MSDQERKKVFRFISPQYLRIADNTKSSDVTLERHIIPNKKSRP